MLQHTSTEKMHYWPGHIKPLLNEIWKIFKKKFGRTFILYQPLHYITYLNQTAPLFEILHHEKIKTQNVTAMVKLNCLILILPDLLKNILMLHIQTLLKNIKINCFIHCNHWKMCVNIKNIWNDNYKVCIVQMSQSSEGRWDKVVFWGFFRRHIPVEQRKYDFFFSEKARMGKIF